MADEKPEMTIAEWVERSGEMARKGCYWVMIGGGLLFAAALIYDA